MEYKCILLN